MGARSAPTICSSHLTRWCLGTRLSRTMKTSSAALKTFGMRTGCDEAFLGVLLISSRRKLDLNGKEAVLHRFSRNEGADPLGGVMIDSARVLYGSTTFDGIGRAGTIFKLVP